MQVIISNKAYRNIEDIYKYLSKYSLRKAKKIREKIYYYLDYLEHSKYLGRYVPEIMDKRFLEVIFDKYRIVYSIFEEEKVIYIHFVIHGKRDFKRYFRNYMKEISF